MAENKSLFVHGIADGMILTGSADEEQARAHDLARRYRSEFIDLRNFHIQHDLFRSIPVDLMFRYNFVPLENLPDGRLVIAIADPSRLMMIDEIGLLLDKPILTKVTTF